MTIDKGKLGFGGQWIEVFSTGTHHDDKNNKHVIDTAFLDSIVRNLNLDQHEPPAVIGHPKSDAPAFGWACALRRTGDKLEAQLCDTNPQFEEMVRQGSFKKRSASFYMDTATAPAGVVPALRHVGFLGAAPPAVRGLRDIHFNEGEAITFEFSEGDAMTTEKKTDDAQVEGAVKKFLKEKFPSLFPDEKSGAAASFTEADVKGMIESAVTPLTEKITSLEAKNEELKKSVDSQAGSSKRGELTSFCEELERTARLPKSFRRMGGVEFLESLATLPADRKVITIEFAEETVNGEKKQVEKKVEVTPLAFAKSFLSALPPYVQFGEQFGGLHAEGDASALLSDSKQRDAMRAEMGLDRKDEKKS